MDAKVDDWVVTPRRGKAVEINALWYNALCLLAHWLGERQDPEAAAIAAHAEKARVSFNRRFWHKTGGYLYDVVDGEKGDDPSFRPNQIFAVSLEHPIPRSGALGAGRHRGPRAFVDADGVAVAGTGRARLQAALFW